MAEEPRKWTIEEICNLPDGARTKMKCSCGCFEYPIKTTYSGGYLLMCSNCGNVDGLDENFEYKKSKKQ